MVFKVRQEKFEGPLELLLELIEEEKLSVSEISLARVADDYLLFVKSLENIDPEALAEFLVIAAQLVLIKSRSLLPHLEFSPEEEPADELEKRLKEYQTVRDLAAKLKLREKNGGRILTRESFQGMQAFFYPPPKLSFADLKAAFLAFYESLPKIEKLAEEKIRRMVSLEEKISRIRDFMGRSAEIFFSEAVRGAKEKTEIIVSFLAILELAKQRFLQIRQNNPFGDIKMTKIT